MNKVTEWPQGGCPHLTQNQISVLTIVKALPILMEVTWSLGPLKIQQTHLKVIGLKAAKDRLDQLWMISTGWHKRQLSQVGGVWSCNLAVWSTLHSWKKEAKKSGQLQHISCVKSPDYQILASWNQACFHHSLAMGRELFTNKTNLRFGASTVYIQNTCIVPLLQSCLRS